MSKLERITLHPLFQLTLARMREFVREPEALFWVFVFPVLLALALGVAFRNRPQDKVRVAVEDSPRAAAMVELLSGSSELRVTVSNRAEADAAMRRGKEDLLVRVADGGTGPRYEFIFDPTRSEARVARLAAAQALTRNPGRDREVSAAPVIKEVAITAPGARYIDFLIPGLIGLNLMGSGMWGVGFNIVQARSKKLLRRMAATPMRRSHFLLSYILGRMIFLGLEVAAVVVFGWLAFGVRVEGSVAALVVVALLGSLAFAGLGVLVASRSQSVEAVSGWMNFVMMPMWVLSGSLFSYERFPAVFHPLIRLLPLTAANDALRAVMSDGAPLLATWPELLVLGGWGLLSFVLALRFFRWQ
jgi:ABC-2 type transport system permease protein